MAPSKKTDGEDQQTSFPDAETAESVETSQDTDSLTGDTGTDTVAPTAEAEDSGSGDDDSPDATEPAADAEETPAASDSENDDPSDDPDAIEDAEIIEEIPAEADETDAASTDDAALADGDDTVIGDAADDETLIEDDGAPLSASEDDSLPSADPDPEPEPEAKPAPPPPPAPEPERKSVMPMVLGGAVAAALGFGAAQFGGFSFLPAPPPNPAVQATLDAQQSEIDALRDQVSAAPEADTFDAAPLTDALGALDARVTGIETALTALETAQAALADELSALASNTSGLGGISIDDLVSDDAMAAYEAELASLQATVAESRAEIERIADAARQSEAAAATQAMLAESRAALAEVLAALQAGQPFDAPVSALESNGVSVPGPLSAPAPEGLTSPVELVEGFPSAARAALAAARDEGSDTGGSGGFASFFRQQLGARSVTPRDGDDPDAVLSRAEAALRAGDLDAALTEIESLPDAAQAAMGDWLPLAQARRDALAAASALARDLGQDTE